MGSYYYHDRNYNLETGDFYRKFSSTLKPNVWDAENRLNQVFVRTSDNSLKREMIYKYDGVGRRILKTSNGITTKFALDNEDIVIEFNGDDSIAAIYLHGPGIDEPIAMARDVLLLLRTSKFSSCLD